MKIIWEKAVKTRYRNHHGMLHLTNQTTFPSLTSATHRVRKHQSEPRSWSPVPRGRSYPNGDGDGACVKLRPENKPHCVPNERGLKQGPTSKSVDFSKIANFTGLYFTWRIPDYVLAIKMCHCYFCSLFLCSFTLLFHVFVGPKIEALK